jgi:ParB family chromosome partitioning protein
MANRGLGRGISALIPSHKADSTEDKLKGNIIDLPLSKIIPNKNQPRSKFDKEALYELAKSIKEFGILQPIIVRETGKGGVYEIIVGERRFRAADVLGLDTIPSIINKNIDDTSSLEMALVENIHREDLSPIELSYTFKQLIEEFKLTHEQLSKRVGKSRTVITNSLRLLSLPLEIQKYVDEGLVSSGHARALLSIKSSEHQIQIAKKIIKNGLSVRQVERFVSREEISKKKIRDRILQFDKLPKIVKRISQYLNSPVKILVGKKKGKIVIGFESVRDLEGIVNKIIG